MVAHGVVIHVAGGVLRRIHGVVVHDHVDGMQDLEFACAKCPLKIFRKENAFSEVCSSC